MCRALVIDDEPDVRKAVRRRLERSGVKVFDANSAAQGILMIREADPPYDVIITDMSMEKPDSGIDVLNAAVARDLFAEVIVLTAYGNVANAVECMRRGAFDYVEKNTPGVDVYELLAIKVEQAMDRRRQSLRTVRKWEVVAESLKKEGGSTEQG